VLEADHGGERSGGAESLARLALVVVRGATGIVIAALVALAVLWTASTAHAAKGMEIALADNSVFLYQSYYKRARAFKHARELGVTRLRVTLPWYSALGKKQARKKKEPKKRKYYLVKWDDLVDVAARSGIRIQLSLTGPAPAFATSNHKVGARRPDARKYARFVRTIAKHFKGRVDRYSIWNEPNYVTWLNPLDKAPSIYRKLYTAGYDAIKEADPRAKVFIGETAPHKASGRSTGPLDFLRKFASAGGPKVHADGFAHHPYDVLNPPTARPPGPNDVSIGALGRLTSELDRMRRAKVLYYNGGGAMPLYLTEFGYFVSGRRKISESRHAKYLKQAFDIALRNGRVRQMLQWGLVSPPDHYFDTSIVKQNGTPRKSYKALRSWVKDALKRKAIAKRPKRITLPRRKRNPVISGR
jgi:hypothetical protein